MIRKEEDRLRESKNRIWSRNRKKHPRESKEKLTPLNDDTRRSKRKGKKARKRREESVMN